MRILPFASALLALVVCLTPAPADDAPPGGTGFIAAIIAAQDQIAGGQLILARQENKNGRPLVGCYILKEPRIIEIEIGEGKVEKMEDKDKGSFDKAVLDALAAHQGPKLPLARFIELAQGKVKGGEPTRIEAGVNQGKLQISVDVTSGKKTTRVTIDASEGKVVKVSDTKSK